LAAITLVDDFLDCRRIGDLLHAALVDDLDRVAAFGPDDLEQVLGDLAGDVACSDHVDDLGDLLGGHR
jgi:hypothetical protein